MRVGLNATCFNNRPSGARQRFVGIYGELIKRNPDIEFVIYEPVDCEISPCFDNAANISTRRTPISPSEGPRLRKVMRAFGYWQPALSNDKLDVFESFNLPLVRAPDCPTILTVRHAPIHQENHLLRRAAIPTSGERRSMGPIM